MMCVRWWVGDVCAVGGCVCGGWVMCVRWVGDVRAVGG